MKTTDKAANSLIPPGPPPGRAFGPGPFFRPGAASTGGSAGAAARPGARAALILAAAAVVAVASALGARAQGSIELDNSQSIGRVALYEPGNYYGGAYGVEVWTLNTDRLPPGINGTYPAQAYNDLSTEGFVRAATFADQNNTSTPGIIRLGELDLPETEVVPKGATVVIALAMWTGTGTSFMNGEGGAGGQAGRSGVLAFVNPTADYTAVPKPVPPALSGWTSDLVLAVIPEPSAFALAAAGTAVWLLVRRRGG